MDLALNGLTLYTAISSGRRVLVNGEPTKDAPAPLMGERIAVSPDGQIAVTARTAGNIGYGCIFGQAWVELGPTSKLQGVAWVDGRFLFARVVWSEGTLYEQTLDTNVTRMLPCDTSTGILYHDEREGWVPVSQRVTVAGSYHLIRAVRRGDWLCGQATNPDRILTVKADGSVAFTAGGQVDVPVFVTSGDTLACVVIANNFTTAKTFTPPYPVERVAIPAIGRPMRLAFFFAGGQEPHNCELRQVSTWEWGVWQGGKQVAVYVSGHPADGNLQNIEQSIAAVKSKGLPTWAYWPRALQQGRLPRGADLIVVEAYRRLGEPLSNFESAIRFAVKRCGRAALACQCYSSNATLTSYVVSLPPVYARVARDLPNVEGLAVFSGSGRAKGWGDHPEVHALWRELADGIPSAPSVGPTLQKPKVGFLASEVIGADKTGLVVRFINEHNPEHGTFEVTLDEGIPRVEIVNAGGRDRSGKRPERRVL